MSKQYIKVIQPTVELLHYTPIAVAEIAARVCYNSFDKADETSIRLYDGKWNKELDNVTKSDLLERLSHVLHHESVAEHVTLNFHVKDIGRGVLQELARHRVGTSLSVRSTRYTFGELLLAYLASIVIGDYEIYRKYCIDNNLLITKGKLRDNELAQLHSNIYTLIEELTDITFLTTEQVAEYILPLVTNATLDTIKEFKTIEEYFDIFAPKRNIGDRFKTLVTDNWSTELIITLNLRSLKHFNKLRNSGAAWYQIQTLAKVMLETLPKGHKRIIIKENKVNE